MKASTKLGSGGGTAGIAVLDDDCRRFAELAHQIQGAIQIEDIVVRELLAVQDFGAGDASMVAAGST